MGFLTTHILDTAQGIPGCCIPVSLYRISDQLEVEEIKTLNTNSDGRTDNPLLSEKEFAYGTYELIFNVTEYFKKSKLKLSDPPFLGEIPLRFSISTDDHYHVPLLVSPWSYSTYRGS